MQTTLKFYEGDPGTPVEDFTEQEATEMNEYVTNWDSNIYGWKIGSSFTPEQAGALLSRYSRTSFTGRRLLLKEFLPNKDRGKEFFEAWLVDYGDDSIQEMAGGLPMSCEYVSNVMSKEIEDCRFGSYIEKSTRYVAFDKKLPNGSYMYYRDKDIGESRYADQYINLMESLFASYVKHMPAMIKYITDLNPMDSQKFKVGDTAIKISECNKAIEDKYGIMETDLKKAYENSVKAQGLDLLRDYLPMATLTHIGMSMNPRTYENMILKLVALPSAEANWIGKRMHAELSKTVPSLIKRTFDKHGQDFKAFLAEKNSNTRSVVAQLTKDMGTGSGDGVTLIDYTGKGEKSADEKAQIVLSSIVLYKYSQGLSLQDATEKARRLTPEQRKEVIAAYVGKRGNRRHKPGRAFENIEYLFDLRGRIGIYRDLHRHRIGTQERQNFSVKLGFNTRNEYKNIGIEDDYNSLMKNVIELYNNIYSILPYQAQYVVTLGFNTRWYYRLNARQLFHFSELRTTPGGHPDYRKMVQDMYYKIKEVHPTITNHMNYIDLNDKPLGRLESEVRIAVKRKALEQK